MTDRLDEIKARVGQAHKAVILDQPWTESQRLDGLEASYTLVHKDIPWLIDRLFVAESNFNMADVVMRRQDTEIERLRAALKRHRAILESLKDDMECWGAYAGDYFQEKHDLAGDLARIDRFMAEIDAALADQGGES